MIAALVLGAQGAAPPLEPPHFGPQQEHDVRRSAARPPLTFGSPLPRPEIAEWVRGEAPDFADKSKTFLILFWSSAITPARESVPLVSAIAQKYQAQGVVAVAITQEPAEGVRPLIDSPAFTDRIQIPVGCDPDSSAFNQFMRSSWQSTVPTLFLAHNGQIEWIGTPREAERVLQAVLAGKWTPADRAEGFERDAATMQRATEYERQLQVLLDRRDWPALMDLVAKIEADEDESLAREGQLLRISILQKSGETAKSLETADTLLKSSKDWRVASEVSRMLVSELYPKPDLPRAMMAALRGIGLSSEREAFAFEALAEVQVRSGLPDLAIRSLNRALKIATPDERIAIEERIAELSTPTAPTPPPAPVAPTPQQVPPATP